jgi:hypothetical protein
MCLYLYECVQYTSHCTFKRLLQCTSALHLQACGRIITCTLIVQDSALQEHGVRVFNTCTCAYVACMHVLLVLTVAGFSPFEATGAKDVIMNKSAARSNTDTTAIVLTVEPYVMAVRKWLPNNNGGESEVITTDCTVH